MNSLLLKMAELARAGQAFALATVLTQNGSAPRAAGAQMLVLPDGSIFGTVGGGQMEAQTIRLCREAVPKNTALVREFFYTGRDAASSDSICGGRQEVLVESLHPGEPGLTALLEESAASLSQRTPAWWVTLLPEGESDPAPLARWLVRPTGVTAVLSGGPSLRVEQLESGGLRAGLPGGPCLELKKTGGQVLTESAGLRLMAAPLDTSPTVFIFGAGHVARQIARLTQMVDFRTVVLDDRPEFNNLERFPQADQLVLIRDYAHVFNWLPVDERSFIVIVTRGHLNDQKVLECALQTRAAYIGMIGSKRKTLLILQDLKKAGFSQQALARVHAPIGMPIDADTPEEIAVSITAELIQVRAGLNQ